MIPLLVASAFALIPPPTAFEFEKPPNPWYRDDLDTIIISDRRLRTQSVAELRHLIERCERMQCWPQESLAIEHREGGLKSGFGPLPPGAFPPAPLTSAGFWSMSHERLRGGLGRGGLGGLALGGGGRGGATGGAATGRAEVVVGGKVVPVTDTSGPRVRRGTRRSHVGEIISQAVG